MNFSSIMKGIGTGMLILTPFLNADAVRLSPEQALRRVEGTSTRFRIPGNSTYRLAHTESVENEPMLYVFNKGTDGFVITSADDALPALLGYSDAGAFDPEEASPELKWWLGQYADEAAWGLENGPAAVAVSSEKAKAAAPRADIPEMLTSRWNQDAPFNLDCPKIGSQQCVTGCVATAMAQVIRYHGYPVQGSGEYSYQWNGKVLDFNYGATTFNYADMLDVYDAGSTPEQRQAVAALMYACGVSVNMSYSSVESGASDMYVPYALKTFFNYDAGTRMLNRNSFTTEEWEDLVYGELSEGRPVIYGGQAPAGGHEFVCDGYENGYFHINWGWAGMGNGYFLLSALDPGLQGIGGFAGGYNSNQTMIYGAAPSPGGTPWYPIYATGSLGYSNYQAPFKAVDIEFISGGVHNYSPEAVEVSFRLRCVSDSGSEFFGDPRSISFRGAVGGSAGGYNKFTMQLPSDLAEGNYKVYLGFETPEGNWQDVLCPLTVASYFNLTAASDGSYSFSEGEPAVKSKLRVTAFAPASAVLPDELTRFDMTVENIGEVEFSNAITIRVYDKGIHTESLAAHSIGLNIGPGEVFNGYAYLSYTLPDGDYDVIVYDQYEEVISDVFPLYVGVPPVMVDRVILDTTDVSMEVESTLQLTATVLPEDAVDKSLIWSSSNPEVANVDQDGMVTAFTPGTAIITVKSAANEDIAASCLVVVKAKVIEAEGVALDRTEATLTEGETLTLTATVDPDETTDKTLTWTSSDEEVATVEDGVVSALKPGTATITVSTSNGKTASCDITVNPKEPEIIYVSSVSLDQTDIEVVSGTVITLVATVLPEDATDKVLLWSSSNEEVASVDQNGTVTIHSIGTAVITAETTDGSEIKAECHISGVSLLEAIESDAFKADVYTFDGLLIKSDADGHDISNLAKGSYIIRVGGKAHKIIK